MRSSITALALVLSTGEHRARREDEEIIEGVEKKLAGRARFASDFLTSSKDLVFWGDPPPVYEHRVSGISTRQLFTFPGHSSGKSQLTFRLAMEMARQRGVKVTSMIHDDMQLEGKKEDVEVVKKALGLV